MRPPSPAPQFGADSENQDPNMPAMMMCTRLAGRAIIRVVSRCNEAQENKKLGTLSISRSFKNKHKRTQIKHHFNHSLSTVRNSFKLERFVVLRQVTNHSQSEKIRIILFCCSNLSDKIHES